MGKLLSALENYECVNGPPHHQSAEQSLFSLFNQWLSTFRIKEHYSFSLAYLKYQHHFCVLWLLLGISELPTSLLCSLEPSSHKLRVTSIQALHNTAWQPRWLWRHGWMGSRYIMDSLDKAVHVLSKTEQDNMEFSYTTKNNTTMKNSTKCNTCKLFISGNFLLLLPSCDGLAMGDWNHRM